MTPGLLLQALVSGALTGCLYALLAAGFGLVSGVARVFNLAHGELVILGAYVGEILWANVGWSPLWSLPLAAIPPMLLAAASREGFERVGEPFELRALVLTFAAALFLQAAYQALFSSDYRLIAVPGWERAWALGPVRIARGRVIIAAASLATVLLLHLFLARTFVGKAMRAASQDRKAASLMGIDVRRVDRYALALGGALAGFAGPLFGSIHAITPAAGLDATLVALILTIFGGVGRVWGLLVGGITLGVAESLAVVTLGARWKEGLYLLVLLVLLRRFARGLLAGRRY